MNWKFWQRKTEPRPKRRFPLREKRPCICCGKIVTRLKDGVTAIKHKCGPPRVGSNQKASEWRQTAEPDFVREGNTLHVEGDPVSVKLEGIQRS